MHAVAKAEAPITLPKGVACDRSYISVDSSSLDTFCGQELTGYIFVDSRSLEAVIPGIRDFGFSRYARNRHRSEGTACKNRSEKTGRLLLEQAGCINWVLGKLQYSGPRER